MKKTPVIAALSVALSVAALGREPNYDESKVGPYTLEDPLTFADGRKVVTKADWVERRKEIVDIFAREMYGRIPPDPEAVVPELLEEEPALAGMGIRRQYRVWFRRDKSGPFVDWLVLIPNRIGGSDPQIKDGRVVCENKERCPVILFLNYDGNHTMVMGSGMRIPVEMILARGYAVMTACYGQISPDIDVYKGESESLAYTRIFDLWPPRDPARDDNITALGAWAWTLSRGLDLALTIPEIDAERNVATGYSRLAKAALLACSRDERFKVCVPNQTGGGGVPLAKRDFGENVSTEMAMFPHWYCKAYGKYVDNEQRMKFDQHLLVASIAPRAILVQGFNSGWFDTKGEYLSCLAASPAWEVNGLEGLPKHDFPDNYDSRCIGRHLGYVRRGGRHGISGCDWQWTLDFADRAGITHLN